MSVNWDSLIENHFKNKNKINFCKIVEMVSEQMESRTLQEEGPRPKAPMKASAGMDAGEKRKGIPYPQLRITNDWGTPGTQERNQVDVFVRQIQKTAADNTIQARIHALRDFTESCTSNQCRYQTIPEVLSFITMLDAFSAIRYKFEAQAAGWMFEAFLAAIIGGTQETERDGASLPIEDVIRCTSYKDEGGEECMAREAFSLKFVNSPGGQGGTQVGMLYAGLEKFGTIEYIIAVKLENGVDFYTAKITESNVDDMISVGTGGKKWGIRREQLEGPIKMHLPGEKEIRMTAETALGVLGAGVEKLYANLDNLSHFLSAYFVDEDKAAAGLAQKETKELSANVQTYING